jgi:hypothetical protein
MMMAYGESELKMVIDKIKASYSGYIECVWMGSHGNYTVLKVTDQNSFSSYPLGHIVMAHDSALIYMSPLSGTNKDGIARHKRGAGVRVIVPASAVVGVTREKFTDIRAEYQLERSH